MLAYVFWHRPLTGVSSAEYEDGLRAFHGRLPSVSASFRIGALPFGDGGPGYEDWYLVADWTSLGELNVAAVSGERRSPHDAVAGLTAEGWAGVYLLVRGDPRPPLRTRWTAKPRGASYAAFLDGVAESAVWQRQMTLGPAPEFCLGGDGGDGGDAGDAGGAREAGDAGDAGDLARAPVYLPGATPPRP
jgi:hypothetical protein